MSAERRPVGRSGGCQSDLPAAHCSWLLSAACRLLSARSRPPITSCGQPAGHLPLTQPGRLASPRHPPCPCSICACWRTPAAAYNALSLLRPAAWCLPLTSWHRLQARASARRGASTPSTHRPGVPLRPVPCRSITDAVHGQGTRAACRARSPLSAGRTSACTPTGARD
jgi:hypothetical protein